MIAFGCSIITPEVYERRAKVGVELAAESDSAIFAHAASGSIARSYNLLLDTAAALDDLEALVILHEDAEIVDPDFCPKLRRALTDPAVAVVGCVGATGVRGIAWWDGRVTGNSAPYHYRELGGGELLSSPSGGEPVRPAGEVETVYGVMLALSPWAVATLRFDESIGMLHGYDFDICRQARAAGRTVLTADLALAHHHPLDLVKDIEIWVAAHVRAAEKWDAATPADSTLDSWKLRARRAEADAAAARLLAASRLLQVDATARYHGQQLAEIVDSRSWRITEPLRRARWLAKSARGRLARSAPRSSSPG
jgi:Glycosyltransferase like family